MNFKRIDVKDADDGQHAIMAGDQNRRCFWFIYEDDQTACGEKHLHICCDSLKKEHYYQ